MFIAALFIITPTWKQPKCPSTNEWRNRLWFTLTLEYYMAVKAMRTQTHLRGIVLSEGNQSQKITLLYDSTYVTLWKRQNYSGEQTSDCREGGVVTSNR